jgi:hypothetical protein
MKLLSTVTWLSALPRRENATPNYSLNRARSGPYRATASTCPLCRRPRRCPPFLFCRSPGDLFHEISRAVGPPIQSGKHMSQGLRGVRELAKVRKQERFTALLHHATVDLLRDSFFALQRRAAPGVDGMTWREYETGLEDRLVHLHNRVQRRAYRAQPSRRVYIPKADGRQRPLGIATIKAKCTGAQLTFGMG